VGCLLTFRWFPLCIGLPSPSTFREVIASRFVLAGYLLKAAVCLLMPKVVAIAAVLFKVCALVCGVTQYIVKFAKGRGVLGGGSLTSWL